MHNAGLLPATHKSPVTSFSSSCFGLKPWLRRKAISLIKNVKIKIYVEGVVKTMLTLLGPHRSYDTAGSPNLHSESPLMHKESTLNE